MTKRLEILKNSLEKKLIILNQRYNNHFEDIKRTNGQPINDKRIGRVTFNRWERQGDSIRNAQKEVQKTKDAIEWEEGTIRQVEAAKQTFPQEILALIEDGTLNQWRKYPYILFVEGVDKARIYWDEKKMIVSHKFTKSIIDKEQRSKFAKVYNSLYVAINQKKREKWK